ncbi:MAG: aldehyde dehydrogenase family protein [Pseudomonadota bacterium]
MPTFFSTHKALLERAIAANRERGFWRAYADDGGLGADLAPLLGRPFELEGALGAGRLGAERSAWGLELGITYPVAPAERWLERAEEVSAAWGASSIEARTGIALEALARLHRAALILAEALKHATGAPAGLARRAGVLAALEQGLRATALTYEALRRTPSSVVHAPPEGGRSRRVGYRTVPTGLALVVTGTRMPLVTALPALLADLVAGNPVLLQPDPRAVLPLALTARTVREVLAEAGLPRDVLQLCVDSREVPVARRLAAHPAVRLLDHDGRDDLQRWLATGAPHVLGRAPQQGANPVVIDSTEDFTGLADGLALAVARHAGQEPTRPQTLFVPADGIATEQGHLDFDAVCEGLGQAIDRLLDQPGRAVEVTGALPDPAVVDGFRALQALGRIVRESRQLPIQGAPRARAASPLLLAVEAIRETAYAPPQPGPVAFVVRTTDTAESIERAAHGARIHGAVLARVHSTNDHVVEVTADAFTAIGVSVSCNATGTDEAFAGPFDEAAVDLDEGFAAGRFRRVRVEWPEPG